MTQPHGPLTVRRWAIPPPALHLDSWITAEADLHLQLPPARPHHQRVIYDDAGVSEYCIIDPAGRAERCHGPALSEVEIGASQITSPLLPGLELDFEALFS